MEIKKHQEVRLENLLSCRKKIKENEIDKEFAAMGDFIRTYKLNQIGGVITTVHKIDKDNSLLDMEIMIPIEHEAKTLKNYTVKPVFHLVNALHLEYKGNPENLGEAHQEIYKYVATNQLRPITPLYNFYGNKLDESQSIEALKVDLLIGINPSII